MENLLDVEGFWDIFFYLPDDIYAFIGVAVTALVALAVIRIVL